MGMIDDIAFKSRMLASPAPEGIRRAYKRELDGLINRARKVGFTEACIVAAVQRGKVGGALERLGAGA